MTEEEKKAIEIVKGISEDDLLNYWEGPEEPYNAIQVVLNLIQNQDTEINKLNNVIDRIIEYTVDTTYRDLEDCEFEDRNNVKCIKDCKQCIKKYFMKEERRGEYE